MRPATFTVAAIGLLQFAVAQPHRVRHAHRQATVVEVVEVVEVVDTVYAKATNAPEVIVFVNQYGNPVSTVTVTEGILKYPPSSSSTTLTTFLTSSTSAPAVTAATAAALEVDPVKTEISSSSAPVAYTAPAAYAVAVPVASSTPVTTSEPAQTSIATSSFSSESSGYGFAYSPYNSDGSCKTQDQVNTDFAVIPSGYGMVRIYGTDCNQVATVLSAAKSKGLKVFAGIYYLSTLSSEVATIVSAANGDWTSFDTISVGNELVNSGTASASTVVAAIGTTRSLLRAAGYTGPVVTVDTLVASRANPSLCDASDYCAVNCHPFFDGNTVAADSGSFLASQIATLRPVLSNQNQEIVITETGWPWQGEPNGVAVPSPANQDAALSSIKGAFSSNPESVILFSTFNNLWKTNSAGTFDAEQYWGWLGNCPSG